jgi:hypothetical protein
VYVNEQKKYYPADSVPVMLTIQNLSGTALRRLLAAGEPIPVHDDLILLLHSVGRRDVLCFWFFPDGTQEWFSFPEVVKVLEASRRPRSKLGYCVFFTGKESVRGCPRLLTRTHLLVPGLSGSGKTTIANAVTISHFSRSQLLAPHSNDSFSCLTSSWNA